MNGISGWNYRPYRPFHQLGQARLPFVCRLAPGETAVELEWMDAGSQAGHVLAWRKKDSDDPWQTMDTAAACMRIDGLDVDTDYELMIRRKDDPKGSGAVRYFRTGKVPGTVVNYLHPEDTVYAFSGRSLCSPSLVRLPSGRLLASMDVYARAAPQNLTLLFRSDDNGKSWRYVTDLFPCFWGLLFLHRGRLYMQGASTEYGDILIGESYDEGDTWTTPTRILAGGKAAGWLHASMPVLHARGRLFVSVDYRICGEFGHYPCVLSVPDDADLLDGRNWTCSEMAAYDPSWPGAPVGEKQETMEGNMVMGRDGMLLNLLRVNISRCQPGHGMALLMEADPEHPENALRFHRFINMPSGSNSKSYVLYDPESGQYIAIGNICVDPQTPAQRTVLALEASSDLYQWRIVRILLDYRYEDPTKAGLQYITFIIDGDDILYLSRTALNRSRNHHDANYSTFHVLENFRQYL